MTFNNFKVIIAGGGPVGLTAAHALEKAGIDFTLLEQRSDVVIDAGSNLVLLPIGMRALSELGLNDALEEVSTQLGHIDRLDHKGRDIGGVRLFEQMKESLGTAPRVISRHDLTKVLYHNLSKESQSKIFPNKKIQSISSQPDGVDVVCTDGSSFSGSMIIGADGAHSRVRTLMRDLALEHGSTDVNAEKPFLTTYRALWIRIPMDSRLKPGMTCETHGYKIATQLFTGTESAVMGIYERLDEPTRERQRYTAADQDALIERWDDLPLIPDGSLTLGDAYRSKVESGLVSLEEGVVDHWSWAGRIVLTGDAAHKFTPSTGAGCNNGMIDVIALANELHASLQQIEEPVPSQDQLKTVFQRYQDQRMETVQYACSVSSQATALATWASVIHKLIDRYVFSNGIVTNIFANSKRQTLPDDIFGFVHQQQQAVAVIA